MVAVRERGENDRRKDGSVEDLVSIPSHPAGAFPAQARDGRAGHSPAFTPKQSDDLASLAASMKRIAHVMEVTMEPVLTPVSVARLTWV
jgi:hypothetical protein